MNKARRDGLYLLLLGAAIFVLFGLALERSSSFAMMDFKVVYFSARCLAEHCDPYSVSDLTRSFRANGGLQPGDSAKVESNVATYVYPPNAFAVTALFGMLPYPVAAALWLLLTLGGLILASYLMWTVAADSAPVLAGALVFLVLANSELLVIVGNAAGIVVTLCVVAAWCFVRQRFAIAGILCLALALVLKPQDAGFVWLYFLLAGGYRKRALQTLGVAAILSIPAVLWVAQVAPHWSDELRANLAAVSARAGNNDPGPSSSGAHGLGMVADLQAGLSLIRDDPRFYNPISYLVCGALLLAGAVKTLRTRPAPADAWLALAVIAPLTMLPVYHRQYDAKLLLLAIPACAMLWAARRPGSRLATVLTAAALLASGDIPSALLITLINNAHLPATGFIAQLLTAVQVLPTPLTLLAMSVAFLWMYARQDSEDSSVKTPQPAAGA